MRPTIGMFCWWRRSAALLKDVPLTVHEVLLFRDEAHSAASADDAECYAVDGTRAALRGATTRANTCCASSTIGLSRIEATVRLPARRSRANFRRCLRPVDEKRGAERPRHACAGSENGVDIQRPSLRERAARISRNRASQLDRLADRARSSHRTVRSLSDARRVNCEILAAGAQEIGIDIGPEPRRDAAALSWMNSSSATRNSI